MAHRESVSLCRNCYYGDLSGKKCYYTTVTGGKPPYSAKSARSGSRVVKNRICPKFLLIQR